MEDVKLINEKDTNNKTPMQEEIRIGNKGKNTATQKGEQELTIEEKTHGNFELKASDLGHSTGTRSVS